MIPLAALVAGVLMAATAWAAEDSKSSRVPRPAVKIEKGGKCVEPTEEMRRNHMNMILHQRDETLRRGVRTTRHSLKGCIECHASPTTNSVVGKDGFCESCHTYAAVRIDCFECHSASPRRARDGDKSGAHSKTMPEAAKRALFAAAAGISAGMCTP